MKSKNTHDGKSKGWPVLMLPLVVLILSVCGCGTVRLIDIGASVETPETAAEIFREVSGEISFHVEGPTMLRTGNSQLCYVYIARGDPTKGPPFVLELYASANRAIYYVRQFGHFGETAAAETVAATIQAKLAKSNIRYSVTRRTGTP